MKATEESQVTSSDAGLDVNDDLLRGKKRFFERSPNEVFFTFTSKFAYVLWISFWNSKRLILQISDFVTGKIKNKGKNKSLLGQIEQNA